MYYHFRKKYDYFLPWLVIICLVVISSFYHGLADLWGDFLGMTEFQLPTRFLIDVVPMGAVCFIANRQERNRLSTQKDRA